MCDEEFDEFEGTPFFEPGAETDAHNRHLPHWQQGSTLCFVTWRLADALPQEKLRTWQEEKRVWLKKNPEPRTAAQREEYRQLFPVRIEKWLDAGYGECLLRDPAMAEIVSSALLYFHRKRYLVLTFVVMPNHVHVLFRPLGKHKVEQIIKSWKGFTSHELNVALKRSGELWQPDFWDRLIRNPDHFERCLYYIGQNPAEARLQHGEFIYYENAALIKRYRPWTDDEA